MSVTRVMFFTPTLASGGADRTTITLLRELDRTRFEPSLVMLRREGSFADQIPADVRTIELGSRRLAVSVPALTRVIREAKPDVVFAMQGGANLIATLAHTLSRSRARLVISERSALRRPNRSAMRTALEMPAKRVAYRRADVVTAVSRGVAASIVEELDVARDKVHVVYNPVVDDTIAQLASEPVSHPWFAERIPIIVAMGRLVAIKDYPAMLEAFSRVRQGRPVRLFILGEGGQHAAITERARELGIADHVHLAGFDANPFKYLSRARMLLQSSRAEGLPGSIIQAMACGIPVVSTDADFGPREVITNDVDGYLVPVGDVEALAARTAAILDDNALATRLGTAAQCSVARFSKLSSVANYERAIDGTAATPW